MARTISTSPRRSLHVLPNQHPTIKSVTFIDIGETGISIFEMINQVVVF